MVKVDASLLCLNEENGEDVGTYERNTGWGRRGWNGVREKEGEREREGEIVRVHVCRERKRARERERAQAQRALLSLPVLLSIVHHVGA